MLSSFACILYFSSKFLFFSFIFISIFHEEALLNYLVRPGSLFIFQRVSKRIEVLGEWMELIVGDWQRPVMLFGDLQMSVSFSLLVNMSALGGEGRSLTPDFHLTESFKPQHYWHFAPDNSYCGGCPVYCRTFNGIFGIYPLANCCQVDTTKKCLQALPTICWLVLQSGKSPGHPL